MHLCIQTYEGTQANILLSLKKKLRRSHHTPIFQILSILLITSKSSQQKWIIPGGGINTNETAEDAVLREAYEEAGVICDNAKYLGFVQVIFEVGNLILNH